VIKFTTLFGLLAVELAETLRNAGEATPLTIGLSVAFFVVSFTFVYRSFYSMRIKAGG
jgi:K(+)-stimulated pyrophosphate-energized sodium pump